MSVKEYVKEVKRKKSVIMGVKIKVNLPSKEERLDCNDDIRIQISE